MRRLLIGNLNQYQKGRLQFKHDGPIPRGHPRSPGQGAFDSERTVEHYPSARPSHRESAGMRLLEAGRCGCCLSSSCPFLVGKCEIAARGRQPLDHDARNAHFWTAQTPRAPTGIPPALMNNDPLRRKSHPLAGRLRVRPMSKPVGRSQDYPAQHGPRADGTVLRIARDMPASVRLSARPSRQPCTRARQSEAAPSGRRGSIISARECRNGLCRRHGPTDRALGECTRQRSALPSATRRRGAPLSAAS